MSTAPFVTVGIPVYRGELFIEDTLRSIQNQTHHNIKVIISLDGPQPESERLCRPFLEDSRFHLVVQPERLGWVGNTNYLMAQVETPYWYWHPQDDLVDPRFLEVLVEHAERSPEVAIAYSDIRCFGLRSEMWIAPSVAGDAIARQLLLLREHLWAVAFHGLTRAQALRYSGGIQANGVGTFAADTVWMAAAARWGELRRIPVDLYQKRFHSENESMRWATWPAEKRRESWIAHCADMLEQAMLVQATAHERHLLWLATLGRLVSPQWIPWFHTVATLTLAEQVALLDSFFEYLRTSRVMDLPAWLGESWDEIRHGSERDLSWIEATASRRTCGPR
jgi:hypothetical protein